jgi:Na+/H+ antiporter NhaD/arsenite permease-like protein
MIACMWVIFAMTYAGLALGRFPFLVADRAAIALIGAAGMFACGAIGLPDATASIDYETLMLLFGLMLFSAQLQTAGFYDRAGMFLARLADKPSRLLAGIIAVSAALSALLANDVVCLAFTPLLCKALQRAGRDPVPYLLALATSSNIGSVATIIGNPQNMYIGAHAGLPFARYFHVMLIPTLLGLGICWAMTRLIFKKRFASSNETAQILDQSPQADWGMIYKTFAILTALVVYFLIRHGEGASRDRAIASIIAGAALFLSRKNSARSLHLKIDWNLLLLFIGLFVVNGAMRDRGLSALMLEKTRQWGFNPGSLFGLSAVTLALSNLVSNVPAVLLLTPCVQSTGNVSMWYVLALVSTLAGNLTLVGSIANLIVAEGAKKEGVEIRLWTYCLLGIPLTIATVAMGVFWLRMIQ